MTNNNLNTMNVDELPSVPDDQKMLLLDEAMGTLEGNLYKLVPDDAVLKENILRDVKRNLAMYIEVTCMEDPKDAIKKCQNFFRELQQFINVDVAGKDINAQRRAFMHKMNMAITPLIIRNLSANPKEAEQVAILKQKIVDDQKKYLQNNRAVFASVYDRILPPWFEAYETGNRKKELVIQSMTDPEAKKILDDTRAQARRELMGTDIIFDDTISNPAPKPSAPKPPLRRVK